MVAPNQDPQQGVTYHFYTTMGLLHSFTIHTGGTDKKYKYNEALKSYIHEASGQPYPNPITNFNTQVNGFVYPMPAGDSYILYKFPKNTIGQFTAGTGGEYNHEDLHASLFSPFSPSFQAFKNSQNNEVIKQIISKNFYEACYWCRDDNTFAMTAPHKETQQLYFVDKAAQMRVVFPEYFNRFTQDDVYWDKPIDRITYTGGGNAPVYQTTPATSWAWGQYLANNSAIATQYSSNKLNYFRTFCNQFKEYINAEIVKSQTFWTNLSESTSVTNIINHLTNEPVFQTGKAPIEKRKLAIKLLGNSGAIPEIKENAIIKILASVAPDDQAGMLEYIVTNIGLQRVFGKFHDSFLGIGSNNFTKAVTVLSGFIQNPQPNIQTFEAAAKIDIDSVRLISIDQDIFDNRQNDFYIINPDNTISFWNLSRTAYIFQNIPYNQMVPIKFWSSFELGGVSYPKAYITQVPAMFAALLVDKAAKELFSKKAWLVFDGVMLVVGAGEIKLLLKATSWLRKAAIVTNIVGSTMDITLNLLNDGAIDPKIKSKMQIGCLLLQVPDLIHGGSQFFKSSLNSKATDIANYLQGEGASLQHNSKVYMNRFVRMAGGGSIAELEELAHFENYVVALGDDLVGNATTYVRAASGVSDKALVLAHSKNGTDFNILSRLGDDAAATANDATINHRSLAKWITEHNPPVPAGKTIVLLSCSDIETAQNLSNKLDRKIIASDGDVSVYSNGTIKGDNDFFELSPTNTNVPAVNKGKNIGTINNPTGASVILGGGWRNFINDLSAPHWVDQGTNMKTALNEALATNKDMRNLFRLAGADAERMDMAEAWYLLRQRAMELPGGLNAANVLYKKADAVAALWQIRKNISAAKLQELGISLPDFSVIKSFKIYPYDKSYADMLSQLEDLIGALPANKVKEFKKYIMELTHATPDNIRSAYVSSEYLLANRSKLNGFDEIEFERLFTLDNITAVPDITLKKGNKFSFVETKAGNKFFEYINSDGSNFGRQLFVMLERAENFESVKVALNSYIKGLLSTPATLTQQKGRVIRLMKNWEGGKILDNTVIKNKIIQYATNSGYSFAVKTLEDFLNETDIWFKKMFVDNNL